MNLLYGLGAGVLGYFIAHLVFNQPISALIGTLIGLAVAFGYDKYTRR